MKLLITTFIFIIGLINLTYADESRRNFEFFSNDSTHILKFNLKKKWILKDKNGQIVAKIKDQGFTSMTIKISNDGNSIVVINDFVEGHFVDNKTALWIYYKGELKKKYKFTEILDNTCNVALSIWHTTWTINEDYDFNKDQNQFEFETNELYYFSINLMSGEIVKKERPFFCDNNTLIVYGTFIEREGSYITMKIKRYIFGEKQPENKIKFQTDFYSVCDWAEVIVIKDGKNITPLEYLSKVIINKCLIE